MANQSYNPIKLGNKLKKAREYLNISGESAAESLDLSVEDVTEIEAGRYSLELEQLVELSRLYMRPVAYFFDVDPKPDNETDDDLRLLARKLDNLDPDDLNELLEFAEFLKLRNRQKNEK
ncbi:helix-turn-helix transcriptional regulator [Pleionea mediterranea]|uniref:HTH cro/C1-type domain-containing protein n=1 Tax=Pleionea mediterranea TaxID=523701 RepID=A0A316FXK2_9GAMM|nr:helix-turn-helix transcriptional regulator [Pleionea mediterranea]PWK52845.1 hypothetical protein C8D97_10463 [Pleionea mediterranea]